MQPVVIFELNEVPWRIVDWWVGRHPDSHLAALLSHSSQWTTIAPDEGHLSPWVTWPTVHRGVSNTVHGIGHFGQDTSDADAMAPPWWVVASAAGRSVGIFGLLHTGELPDDVERYAFYVPDTFASTPATHPRNLEAFQDFNLSMARASARNVSAGIDVRAARRFVLRAPFLGLRPATAWRVARQLVAERRNPDVRVRRRSFQSVLAFDVFERALRTTRPDAAAFFTNHVASAMHRYWAATFPEDYAGDQFGFDAAWVQRWGGELEAAFEHADRMVGRLRRHCDDTGATLLFASSMGQRAAQGTPVSRQLYLRDLDAFLRDVGVDPARVERQPAMDPHVNVEVDDPADLDRLRRRLDDLRIGGISVEWHEEANGFVSMAFGQADDAIATLTVGDEERRFDELGFEIVEIEDQVASSGYHVPEGILVHYDPAPAAPLDQGRHERPTTTIAPMILELLDVPAPASMALT